MMLTVHLNDKMATPKIVGIRFTEVVCSLYLDQRIADIFP
jgi:hypothetical protein